MKRSSFLLGFLLPIAAALAAEPNLVLDVWPGIPPGDKPGPSSERWTGMTLNGVVTTPTLAVYRPPPSVDTGAAVLICPGGGFFRLSMGAEGIDVALWLNSIGVTGIVLKYRVPNREGMPRHLAALQDAQRALSIIRTRGNAWHLDSRRIGILGFSAGGQVAAILETNFDRRAYSKIDDIDNAEPRPDFAVLIYPGGVAKPNSEIPALVPEVRVANNTPPTFLSISYDDSNGSDNAVYLYLAMKHANVAAELHVWGEGGHGYGIAPGDAPHTTWPARVASWMAVRGLLNRPGSEHQ